MHDVTRALIKLTEKNQDWQKEQLLTFAEFLEEATSQPALIIRSIYQLYADMIDNYICEEIDEYQDDLESMQYVAYDCQELLAVGTDRPFFADQLFANRLVRHVDSLSIGAQQNKVYIFDGPPGSGKSTFLNNLLRKFEDYTASSEGLRYEIVWRLPDESSDSLADDAGSAHESKEFDVPCPSHDNPVLIVPLDSRRRFFDDLFENDSFKWEFFTAKKFEWVFNDQPCTICSSIFDALMQKYHNIGKVLEYVYARPYKFNRRLGEGISVFNPGDKPTKRTVLQHEAIQKKLDTLFPESRPIRYLHSHYARTNNGIYALMDIKSHNTERLMELHNIISEGVHKVEELEESVKSLFFALMNPEDKKQLKGLDAFRDRIEYIHIPYVLDINTEVDIYREIFGTHIDESFLPRVLHNFARVIIATRLEPESEAMRAWITDPGQYELYCDKSLLLLKMEVYAGTIPSWLSEADLKGFTAKRRRQIHEESIKDGWKGFSGRDSIRIFNEFLSTYSSDSRLIDMSMLVKFFNKYGQKDEDIIPEQFLDSLLQMYNYIVLQEVKEALYYYNEEQIAIDIQNYIFAVNFDPGTTETCLFTGEKLHISEELFSRIETRLVSDPKDGVAFRNDVQKTYTTSTLSQEIMQERLPIVETTLFQNLFHRYVHNLKEKVLEPFFKNENFRMAIRDFDTDEFRTYDDKIGHDVTFMINNLQSRYDYTRQGAKAICLYVIDNDIAQQFEGKT
jgi:predicted Ser/Thr protein kinase